jgi:hypothetical protein
MCFRVTEETPRKSDRQKINRITFDLFLKIFVLHGVKKNGFDVCIGQM